MARKKDSRVVRDLSDIAVLTGAPIATVGALTGHPGVALPGIVLIGLGLEGQPLYKKLKKVI